MDSKPTYALLLASLVATLFTGAFAGEAPFRVAPLAKDNYLLIDKAGIDAAKRKAETQPWAKAALDAVLTRAARDVNRSVTLPPRGGQWPHWYSCKKDGGRLVTDSPTSHRCRVCGTVYHGDPYDAVVFYGEHSRWAQSVRNLGLAYRFTGRREYAQKAGEILVAYADRYAGYPLHDIHGNARVGGGRIMAQTLDESVWLIPVAFGYALVRETMSDAARAHVEKDLLVAAADVIRSHKMGIHNIQCWKNSAVGLAGLVANNEALVREAIEDPQRGFVAQVAKGITDDGLWYEGSMGYHRYTMDAFWPLAEAARLGGVDLYGDRFRSMFDAPLALALPDGQAPGFNDNSGGNVRQAAALYELAYARWKVPEYGRLAAHSDRRSLQALLYGEDKLPEGPFVPTASTIMRSAGFAMLRADGNAVAIRFGKHGGGHGHPDKLNDYAFHAVGKFSTSLELKARGPLGYLHVEKVSEAHPSGDWWAEWEQGVARWRLNVKGVPGTIVYTAVGPGRNPADRVPLVIVRRRGKETVYDCLHEFGAK